MAQTQTERTRKYHQKNGIRQKTFAPDPAALLEGRPPNAAKAKPPSSKPPCANWQRADPQAV